MPQRVRQSQPAGKTDRSYDLPPAFQLMQREDTPFAFPKIGKDAVAAVLRELERDAFAGLAFARLQSRPMPAMSKEMIVPTSAPAIGRLVNQRSRE